MPYHRPLRPLPRPPLPDQLGWQSESGQSRLCHNPKMKPPTARLSRSMVASSCNNFLPASVLAVFSSSLCIIIPREPDFHLSRICRRHVLKVCFDHLSSVHGVRHIKDRALALLRALVHA